MLPDLSSANENRTTLHPFWKKQQHWLPVEARIHCKLATLVFRHFENSLPPYLSELLHTYQPSQTLRSSSEKLLKIPKTNLKSAGKGSFHFQAAKIRNSLPTTVRNSPSHLFHEKSENASFRRTLLSWFLKHIFCTIWLLSGWVDVEEVVLIWLLMSSTV